MWQLKGALQGRLEELNRATLPAAFKINERAFGALQGFLDAVKAAAERGDVASLPNSDADAAVRASLEKLLCDTLPTMRNVASANRAKVLEDEEFRERQAAKAAERASRGQ